MQVAEQKKLKVPKLRFREFEDAWTLSSIENHYLSSAFGPRFSSDLYDEKGNVLTLRTTDMDNDGNLTFDNAPIAQVDLEQLREHILEVNDLVVSRSGTIGVTGLFKGCHMPVLPGAFLIRIRLRTNELKPEFTQYFLNSTVGRSEVLRVAAGGVQKNVTSGALLTVPFHIPPLPEQQKIAGFLNAVDEKLKHLNRKKELLQQYKKGVMQKLFSQELRFKREDGSDYEDWEEKRLGDVFERVTQKNKENNLNVLTISAQFGLINQEEYFNKSVSASNVTGYYLLHKGEFAYNKSYSNGYPMGAIKRLNRYEKGVVSTLYICFRIKTDDVPEYWEQILGNGGIDFELEKIAQEGARNHGLLNLSVVEFFRDIAISRPCLEEQQKIADFLRSLDEKIEAVSAQIELTQQFKKGLLQEMFV